MTFILTFRQGQQIFRGVLHLRRKCGKHLSYTLSTILT